MLKSTISQTVIPTSSNHMYVVFESYYKHGEVESTIIKSDEEMRDFCVKYFKDDYEILTLPIVDSDGEGEILVEDLLDYDVSNMPISLDSLMKQIIINGDKRVEQQGGWGVRYIIKGYNLAHI